MADDVMAMADGMGEKFANTFNFACQALVGVIIGFVRSPVLAAVILCFVPILMVSATALKVSGIRGPRPALTGYPI